MESTTDSDLILEIVIWATLGFASLCLVLVVIAGLFRWHSQRLELSHQKLYSTWRLHLNQAIDQGSLSPRARDALPPLARRDYKLFLEFWSEMHAYVRGSGDQGLNQLAAALHMPDWITPYLTHRDLQIQLSAITALGYLEDANPLQVKLVRRALHSQNRLLSITALRCLLKVDLDATLQALPSQLGTMNWSDSRLLSALQEAPHEPLMQVLEQALSTAPLRRALKCYRLCERLRGYTDRPTTERLLHRFGDEEAAISQFLRLVNSPALIELVRPFLQHDSAGVRAQAIIAVGHIGSRHDMEHLVPLLKDSDAWVRFDAAATLLLLPGVEDTDIEHILEQLEPKHPGRMVLYSLAHTFTHQTSEGGRYELG